MSLCLFAKLILPDLLTSILIIFVAGVLMSYGGISGIVLMMVLMPLTLEIIKESRIPRYMAPGILLGALATAALAMPGTALRFKILVPFSTWVPPPWPRPFRVLSAEPWS